MKNLIFLSKAFITIVAMLSIGLSASAHDFEADGIYYNFSNSSNNTVKVTYRGDSYDDYSNEYYGAVSIPNSVTHNGITYSVTEIGNLAFYGCYGLTEATIPNSVTTIGNNAFMECTGMTVINISNSVTSIGNYAFYNCSGLTEITIPKVASIGHSVFCNCSGLTEVTIPNSVTKIGDGAFQYCYKLTEVTIGNSITYIGRYAFAYCYLDSVTSYCETPPICDYCAFGGSYSALLNVPEGTKDAYVNAYEWRNFTNITETAGVEGIEIDKKAIEVVRYDIYGRLLSEPTKGINIVKYSDGTTKKFIIKN